MISIINDLINCTVYDELILYTRDLQKMHSAAKWGISRPVTVSAETQSLLSADSFTALRECKDNLCTVDNLIM